MIVAIILVILVFGLLVFVHELGHFLAARLNGIDVEEFGFGFPPRVLGVKRGRTIYSINAIPLGGFVRLKGEDQVDNSRGSFGAASLGTKALVLLAGVVMNLVVAYLILVVLAARGLPSTIPGDLGFVATGSTSAPQVMILDVVPDSPAAKAGLKRGDIITDINGQTIATEQQLIDFTSSHAGQAVQVYLGGRTPRQLHLTLNGAEAGKTKGYLGVTAVTNSLNYYGWQSPVVAAVMLGKLSWATVTGFIGVIVGLVRHGQVSQAVVGPVGVVNIFSAVLAFGAGYILFLVAQISISLAVINTLPIPALDGGRLAITLLRKLFKNRISARLEGQIHTVGFFLLLLLMAVITLFDVRRLGK